jgi:hypothetical protein
MKAKVEQSNEFSSEFAQSQLLIGMTYNLWASLAQLTIGSSAT